MGKRSKAAATADHVLAVYDDTTMVGSLVERDGAFQAFNIGGVCVGTFSSMREAARALPHNLAGRRWCLARPRPAEGIRRRRG